MSKKVVKEAFHEVMGQVPARVKHTRRKKGDEAARKMQIAIALDKARERGAKIPRKGK